MNPTTAEQLEANQKAIAETLAEIQRLQDEQNAGNRVTPDQVRQMIEHNQMEDK